MPGLQVPQNILHDPGHTAQEKTSLRDPIFLLPLSHCCLLNTFSNCTVQAVSGWLLLAFSLIYQPMLLFPFFECLMKGRSLLFNGEKLEEGNVSENICVASVLSML